MTNEAHGKCHVCAMRDDLPPVLRVFAGSMGKQKQAVRYCPMCGHWFCSDCWNAVMGRITGFVKHFVKKEAGCCGPTLEEG